MGSQNLSGSSKNKAETNRGHNALPRQGTLHTHTHSLEQCTHINPSNMNIFGRWEETGVSGENLPRYERNVPSPHRRWPWLGIDIFFSHQI